MGFKLLPPPDSIQDLTREILLDHRGAFQDVADLLGWPRTTLDSHLQPHKVKTLNWDAVRATHAITQDRRLWAVLVGEGFIILPDPASLNPSSSFDKESGDVHITISQLQAKARKFKEDDGTFDLLELEELEADAGSVLKEVSDIFCLIDRKREQLIK